MLLGARRVNVDYVDDHPHWWKRVLVVVMCGAVIAAGADAIALPGGGPVTFHKMTAGSDCVYRFTEPIARMAAPYAVVQEHDPPGAAYVGRPLGNE